MHRSMGYISVFPSPNMQQGDVGLYISENAHVSYLPRVNGWGRELNSPNNFDLDL